MVMQSDLKKETHPGVDAAPDIRTSLPGPKGKAIIERDDKVISPSYTRSYPFVMDHGLGSYVWDIDGNRFIDFTAGVAVLSTGHAHPDVVRAIQEQAEKVYLHRGIAARPFTRQFDLADYVEVSDASMGEGLLVIALKREIPEALKPRSIPINGGTFMPFGSKTANDQIAA